MNANMRRYLEEDWDEEFDEPKRKREHDSKPPKNQLAQSRRQSSKEWGKAIAKFQRSRDKHLGNNHKP